LSAWDANAFTQGNYLLLYVGADEDAAVYLMAIRHHCQPSVDLVRLRPDG
jgi:hypothetical protein